MNIKLSNNVELYYEKIGQGDPILMLHGNGDSHEGLKALGETLAEEYTVYLIDSRGHGKSSNHGEYFVYEDLAEDIDYFIQELNLHNVSIVGHSDGAIIATLLGIEQKDYLHKIVLLGVTLSPDDLKEDIQKWVRTEYEKEKSPLFKLMINEPHIELEELENIQIPAMVAVAEDEVMSFDKYRQIVQKIKLAEMYYVEGEDHGSYVLNTDKFAGPIKEFIGRDVIH